MRELSDADRARVWLLDWLNWLPAADRDLFEHELADQFREVRRSVGAELRAVADNWSERGSGPDVRIDVVAALLAALAARIERGERLT